MSESDLIQKLKSKGYTDYLIDMFVKMFKDIDARCDEYSKLTGVSIGVFELEDL